MLRSTLVRAPRETTGRMTRRGGLQITLPMPDGTFARFKIEESPVMEPGLAAKFPEIKSYRGRGIDDPAATLRFDINAKTFHAQILSPSGAVYIDPYWERDGSLYMSYAKKDLPGDNREFKCLVEGTQQMEGMEQALAEAAEDSGTMLHTYRLACATSVRYSEYHGGPTMVVADILAALVTMVDRVSGVYETEWAIRLVLVADNDLVIATTTNPTPFSDTPGDIFINPAYLDAQIGAANYDIGHVVTVGSGGIAGLGVVCAGFSILSGGSDKASGTTGIDPPIGDGFWIDYVAHEMGHQFGGNHTFNGDGTNCGGTNQNASTAYEPGSGSTIMAYAGICGAANNLQPHSDPYFHFLSLEEIFGFSIEGPGGVCAVKTPTGNSPPTVSARGPGVAAFPAVAFKIPDQTPFALTAFDGADPDSDPITYCWEEADLGPVKAGTTPDNGSSPLFRSFNPTPNPTRTFPKWADLLANQTQTIGEKLPLTTRKLDFRVTARDNGGGFDIETIRLNSVNSGTGFAVTAPNTAVTYQGGSVQTVTWDVAGTTANGINTANVDILLSTDAVVGPLGEDPTFPIVLAANTPNDGSQDVTIPFVNTTKARVMVRAVGNVYFDISNVNFTITAPPEVPLLGIASRKLHGTAGSFDVALPLSGPPGVECRSGGTNNDHTIVFSFVNALSGVTSASITQGTGTVNTNSGIGPNANQYTVNLTGVANAQHLVVTLFGVQDAVGNMSSAVAVPMDVLFGDINAVSGVTGSDVNLCKTQVGIDLSVDNFRMDINASGFVSGSDVNQVKAQVGTFLP